MDTHIRKKEDYEPGAGCRIRDDYIVWHETESPGCLPPSALLTDVESYLYQIGSMTKSIIVHYVHSDCNLPSSNICLNLMNLYFLNNTNFNINSFLIR